MYPKIQLNSGREKSLMFRHPWIFSRAIAKVPSEFENGGLVSVVDEKGKCLATAYYNRNSQIALRVLAFEDVVIDEEFFVRKFQEKLEIRRRFLDLSTTNTFRLVFSESDGLPGLIVDVYGDFVVVQIHTLGMDLLRSLVVNALVKVLKPAGIYERSDVEVRKKEGLKTLPMGVLYGIEPPRELEILENGVNFFVDIIGGQKTGFFLDQRENRLAVRKYASGQAPQRSPALAGKKVLNLFSYSGGFSVAALKGSAKHVTSVDISAPALELARKNFSANGFDPALHDFVAQDVFDFLQAAAKKEQRYDLIVVDPPAFVKNRDSLNHGTNAYIKLNAQALEVLSDDGILMTSSCSSHVSSELFRTILFKAALQAKRQLTLLEAKNQPPDHPLNINFPEGEYLKFFVCAVKKY